MKTSSRAGALMFGAVIMGGCAGFPAPGAEVRGRPTTTAFDQRLPTQEELEQRASRSTREESPLAHACNAGNSKSCNEVGDRLVLKHAYTGARRWYVTSCERVRSAMVPTATHLVELGREATRLESSYSRDEEANSANQRRLVEVKKEASEIRARIQGCFDAGETLKFEHDLKLALAYYDAVCEFSTLVEAIGEALQGFEHLTESGCAAGQSARTELTSRTPFSPQMFVNLAQQRQPAAANASAAQDEGGMVFTEGDL